MHCNDKNLWFSCRSMCCTYVCLFFWIQKSLDITNCFLRCTKRCGWKQINNLDNTLSGYLAVIPTPEQWARCRPGVTIGFISLTLPAVQTPDWIWPSANTQASLSNVNTEARVQRHLRPGKVRGWRKHQRYFGSSWLPADGCHSSLEDGGMEELARNYRR